MSSFKIHKVWIVLLGVVVLFSCENAPRDVRLVLKAARDNRAELEKVIDHYKSTGEKEKLKAAYFLIGNMDDKYAIGGEELKKYDPIFSFFKSIRQKKTPFTSTSVVLRASWDSLVSALDPLRKEDVEIVPDCKRIRAEFLVKNIDLAFRIRDTVPWGHKISFDQFCEYVLAYRFNHEAVQEWRQYYQDKYRKMLDTLRYDSCHQLASRMHQFTPKMYNLSYFYEYPFDFLIDQTETGQLGSCVHIAIYRAQVMRAAGIPTAIDFTSNWGNRGGGHTWNTILMENGKPFHYEGNTKEFGQNLVSKVAKVYRKTFGRQDIYFSDHSKEIPESLRNDHIIDVTPEYTNTLNISVQIRYSAEKKKKYAIICSHNNKTWIPQDWGKISGNRAFFKNMGVGNLYLAMYYSEGSLYSASDPFIINENGEIAYISSAEDKKQKMLLLRKYPITKYIQEFYDRMIDGRFQGANHPDFRDSVDLHTIKTSPTKIETAVVSNPSKFRYVRFSSLYGGKGDISELEFFGGSKRTDTIKLKGKPIGRPEVKPTIGTPYQNAFDGNINTYFNGYQAKLHYWAGLDLGEPKVITKIKYCPRSDTNFIVEGDRYELCWWNKDKWVSMGEQVAIKPSLEYDNVPSAGLYILHNLSRGKEERPFTWEEGKQVFW